MSIEFVKSVKGGIGHDIIQESKTDCFLERQINFKIEEKNNAH